MDTVKYKFAISKLVSTYHKASESEFRKDFKNFVNDFYFEALENIDIVEDKELIISYTEIINTFNIFNTLLSFEDDYKTIVKVINKNPEFFNFLFTLYTAEYVSHSVLAIRLNKTWSELSKLICSVPCFGLYTTINNKENYYKLTEKGRHFVLKLQKGELIKPKMWTKILCQL